MSVSTQLLFLRLCVSTARLVDLIRHSSPTFHANQNCEPPSALMKILHAHRKKEKHNNVLLFTVSQQQSDLPPFSEVLHFCVCSNIQPSAAGQLFHDGYKVLAAAWTKD